MRYLTIENNGRPWRLCINTNQADLEGFLAKHAAEAVAPGGFTTRPSTPHEAAQCAAAHTEFIDKGGDYGSFFSVEA
ncbi:hypothetical protein GCM10009416_19690 [Craurococcus roseus]|uniref:DUF2188 domain-containing protein n=1 Tax=Craurococcus roseus TaxID=77585 RepID=A0ABN1F3Z7_9PROT